MGQVEQDPDLHRSESNVLGKVQSHLCLTEWRGKSTLGAACPAQKKMFCNLCCTLSNPRELYFSDMINVQLSGSIFTSDPKYSPLSGYTNYSTLRTSRLQVRTDYRVNGMPAHFPARTWYGLWATFSHFLL